MSSENRSTLANAGGAVSINAFRFVRWNGTAVEQASAATQTVLGVSGAAAAAGAQVSVVVSGFVEVDIGAGILQPGDQITSDANGKAVVAAVVAAPNQELIIGEFSPLPLSTGTPVGPANTRGRILLYDNKTMLKV